MGEVRWQGGAEHADAGLVRVGGLYVVDDAICFLEGGRHGAFVAAKTLAGAGAVLLGIPVVVEAYSHAWLSGERGGAPAIAEVQALVAAVACLGGAVVVGRRSRREHDEMLRRVGEPDGRIDPAVLVAMCESSPGSLLLPAADVVEVVPVDADRVEIRTRLDDVVRLRVVPDRDAFVRHARSLDRGTARSEDPA